MWDTSGNIAAQRPQVLSYVNWDAVFICVSLESLSNLARAKEVSLYLSVPISWFKNEESCVLEAGSADNM